MKSLVSNNDNYPLWPRPKAAIAKECRGVKSGVARGFKVLVLFTKKYVLLTFNDILQMSGRSAPIGRRILHFKFGGMVNLSF
jgi:hypothetical protein